MENLKFNSNNDKIISSNFLNPFPWVSFISPWVFLKRFFFSVWQSLDLSNCGIGHLAPDTFEALPRLRILDLSSNMMIQLEMDLFEGLPNLGVLKIEKYESLSLLKKSFLNADWHFQNVPEIHGPATITWANYKIV